VGYAFCNIIFESLLFMSMGAVLYRTGTIQASKLGGIYKSMPWTATFCIIGALSISAFPFFAGFVTKGLILDGVADAHLFVIWLALLFASAGVLEHAGIKIPYFGFFAHDSGKRCDEAPRHMLIAMGVSAALCIAIGIYPDPLYALLPDANVDYIPYTVGHVFTQLQLLLFAVLAFVVLVRVGFYPPEIKSTNLDTDWFYRKVAPAFMRLLGRGVSAAQAALFGRARRQFDQAAARLYRLHGPAGQLARSWPAGSMALWIAILLAVSLIVNYLSV
jgi:multicomponent Na+:H+ antiporter subunit D